MDSPRGSEYFPERMAAAIGGVAGDALLGREGGDESPPLVVASSRSAVVRLAPVAAGLSDLGLRPAVAGLLDGLGRYAPRTLECFSRSPDEVVADVEQAVEQY